jgi:phosphohistidine phosphatase
MKILYVLRHAKSDWRDSSLKDFDRPLNARGKIAAKAIGKEMLKRRMKPDLVLASPAVRAQQTLERVQEAYGAGFVTTHESAIYMAEPEALVDLVRRAPDDVKRLLLVGHNPGLQELVLTLSGPGELLDEAAEKFPTAAFAEIRFDADSWSEVNRGTGILECLLRPRDL